MAYTKRDDVPTLAGEQAVELDTGALVAVSCDRQPAAGGLCFDTRARAVDGGGLPIRDAAGRAVTTSFKHHALLPAVEQAGADAISRDCLLAVLGEAPDIIRWDAAVLASVSIRTALAAVPLAGPVDAGGML